MADNVSITPGTGSTIAADEISGVLYQRVKLIFGADGATSGDVSSANPFPVVVSSGTTAVTGTVTITGATTVINSVTVTGSTAIVGSVAVSSIPAITGSVAVVSVPNITVASMPAITGSVAVVSSPAITGSVAVVSIPNITVASMPAITGSVAVVSSPAITGSVSVVSIPAVTGSVTVIGMPAVTGSVSIVGSVVVTGNTSMVIPLRTGRFSSFTTTTNCTTAIEVVAAVAGKFNYVSSYLISALAAGQYWLEDGAGTPITSRHFLAANGGASFTCVAGQPIATAISNTTIKVKSTVAGSTGCLVVGYQEAG